MSDGTPVEVDVNTDDLDAFTDLFTGKATEKKAEVVEEVPAEDDTGATDDQLVDEADELEGAEADAPATDEPVVEDDEEDILKPKPKKKQTVQERISELTRQRHEAERREADALRRLADAEAARNSPKPEEAVKTPVAVTVEAGAPDPSAQHGDGSMVYPLGEFDPNYIVDLTRFTISKENAKAVAERIAAEQTQRQSAAEVQLQTEWAGKLTEAEKVLPDLRPTIATLEAELSNLDPALGTYLAQTIMGMSVGPQVLYYLANNVEEAQKIVAAGPVGATLALGKLEDRIERNEARKASKEAPAARVSAAPEPPVTTRGTATRSQVADDTDDLDAFEAKFFKKK